MLSYRKQMMLISLFALVFMSLGLFTTFYSMKRITQWPVEDMLSFHYEAEKIQLKLVGQDFALDNVRIPQGPAIPQLPLAEKLKAAPAAARDSLIKLFQDTRSLGLHGYRGLKEIVVDKLRQFR
ncbi:MAG: hypothetical protein ACOY3J_09250 [Bacillota bacterium]|uniref:Uncharacterized protein n=1 Tax=Thermanaerosceptrum fracticalcis TaxID=1712410 RepID=A0A7G6E263_THEFR|nr:hypothetical protein [Thermanaerosceptrum fracticalcis]QNB46167.1 hypothetical protein BR63_07475 [Thermanaerosceptrum fracticalcis]